MQRRRFKNTLTFPDRLKNFADDLKAKAAELRPGAAVLTRALLHQHLNQLGTVSIRENRL